MRYLLDYISDVIEYLLNVFQVVSRLVGVEELADLHGGVDPLTRVLRDGVEQRERRVRLQAASNTVKGPASCTLVNN